MSTTRVLGLDVSTHAGYGLVRSSLVDLEGESESRPLLELEEHGVLQLRRPKDFADEAYPWNYIAACKEGAERLTDLIVRLTPDVTVIEETNLGKQRYDQKLLEYFHNALLFRIGQYHTEGLLTCPVFYLSSRVWRSALGQVLTKEDKRNNKLLRKAKDLVTTVSKAPDGSADIISPAGALSAAKKSLGVKGKIGPKHLSVRWVNDHFGTSLKMKQNDEADAVCLASAFAVGARPCDGEE